MAKNIFQTWAGICLLTALALFSACDNFLDITPTGTVIPTTTGECRELITHAYSNFPASRGLWPLSEAMRLT